MGSDPKLSAEGVKVVNPPFLVKNDVAEIECVPLTELRGIVCDTMGRWPLFGGGAALSNVFFFASNEVCMAGHVSSVDQGWDSDSDPFVAAAQPSRRPIAGKIFEKVYPLGRLMLAPGMIPNDLMKRHLKNSGRLCLQKATLKTNLRLWLTRRSTPRSRTRRFPTSLVLLLEF